MPAPAKDIMSTTDVACAERLTALLLSSSFPVCTFISSDAMAPATHRKTHHAREQSSSITNNVPDFSKNESMTRNSDMGMRHSMSLDARAGDAGGPAAEDIPHAPPPYTPSIALHAGTATAGDNPSLPTSSISSSSGSPATDANESHWTNIPLLLGGILVGVALLSISAAIWTMLFKKRARKLKATRPRFSMLKPGRTASPKEKLSTLSRSSSFGNFVYVMSPDGEKTVMTLRKGQGRESVSLFEEEKGELRVVNDVPDSHQYSSSDAIRTAPLDRPHNWSLPILTTSVSAPASPLLTNKDFSLHVQRQKAAELEQMVRMKFVREELPAACASCPELNSPLLENTKRPSVVHGLHVVHEAESEVDIASTALCALDRYSVSFDPASPTVPISKLFQVDKDGKVVRLASPVSSPLTPASEAMPTTPQATDIDTASIAEEDDMEDVDDAVIVRTGRAHSVEVQRGVLVSVNTTASLAAKAPHLSTSYFTRPKSTSALPAAPSLSPIVTSPTSLSADIEEMLEERVFAYREHGPWSKEHYKLTTPGQVRALTEALALAKPLEVQQQQKPWPWPAHRSAFADLDDE